jgi:hypothetical protein
VIVYSVRLLDRDLGLLVETYGTRETRAEAEVLRKECRALLYGRRDAERFDLRIVEIEDVAA